MGYGPVWYPGGDLFEEFPKPARRNYEKDRNANLPRWVDRQGWGQLLGRVPDDQDLVVTRATLGGGGFAS